jgi:hypothetical protein
MRRRQEGGTPTTVGIEAGSGQPIRLANPWPGQAVQVIEYNGGHGGGRLTGPPTSAEQFPIALRAGDSYLVEPAGAPAQPFAPVTGQPAISYKTLGPVSIGLPPPASS